MRRLAFSVLLAMLLPAAAQAEFWLGVGVDGGIAGINIEVANDRGSAWILVGAYQSSTGFELFDEMTAVAGVRRYQTGYSQNGYFAGLFLGDVDGSDGEPRLGAGGELGYQWLTDNLRMTLQAGMALAEGDDNKPGESAVKPVPMLGASVSMRL